MPVAVTMPRLGLNMAEGTVTEWKAAAGDSVAKGQVILVIESEKAEVEVEATAAGVLRSIYVDVGTTVPVGALLGAIAGAEEPFDPAVFQREFVPESGGAPATARRGAAAAGAATARSGAGAVSAAVDVVKAAPAARALARKLGIDLATVRGSGPGGRILPEDVERAVTPAVETTGSGPVLLFINGFAVDASGWRRQVGELSADHTVVTFEHRGVGGALPLGTAAPSIGELADDAAALLSSLGEAPAGVVGASMGAAVAVELALRHPSRVDKLVLVTPVFASDARLEAVLRSWAAIGEESAGARALAMLPWLLGRDHLADAGRREAAAAALSAMAARIPAATLRAHLVALLGWLASGGREPGKIAVPVLVIAGDADLLAPLEHARALCDSIPGARLVVFEGAGHGLLIERARELSGAIRRFVAAA